MTVDRFGVRCPACEELAAACAACLEVSRGLGERWPEESVERVSWRAEAYRNRPGGVTTFPLLEQRCR